MLKLASLISFLEQLGGNEVFRMDLPQSILDDLMNRKDIGVDFKLNGDLFSSYGSGKI